MLTRAVVVGAVVALALPLCEGAGPDLGALELGCTLPIYGPRPAGVDESNQSFGCGTGLRFFIASAHR